MSGAPPPSSFDNDPDFYEESRWQKFKRRLIEEPLIPLGCVLTCWALLEAGRSIRKGDSTRTNRMFRRRIYAQGLTILAVVAGSKYWEEDRAKRKQYDDLLDEKKRKEKQNAWIKELEEREKEDEELRQMKKKVYEQRRADDLRERRIRDEAAARALSGGPTDAAIGVPVTSQADQKTRSSTGTSIRSVLEASESRTSSTILDLALGVLGGRWSC